MPCTSSSLKRCSTLMPQFRASFAAVSVDITTSPKICGFRCENSPSRMRKEITIVGPERSKYFRFSFSIWISSTIRIEISPSGQSKAPKMTFAVWRIFFREISQALCRLSIWTSIPCLSPTAFASGCNFLRIIDPMMVNAV